MEGDFYIRPLREQDARESWHWRNDPRIWVHTGSKPDRRITAELELEWIRRALQDDTSRRFAICVSKTHEYIGNIQLTDIRDGDAQLHVFIGNRSYWGRGASTAATGLLLAYARRELKLNRVYLYVDRRNVAAIRSYEKNGFRTVSVRDDRLRQEIEFFDSTAARGEDASSNADVHPYATAAYAATLGHIGRPIEVSAWNTCVIGRRIDDRHADAVGTYPLAVIAPDADIGGGMEALRRANLVSLTLVVDNLWGASARQLEAAFPVVRPFKTHYLVNPAVGPYRPSEHHRDEIRRAARRGVTVDTVPMADIVEPLARFYDELVARRGITAFGRYSRATFEGLAGCPGLTAVAATLGGEVVSCHVWFEHDGFAWSHVGATSALGYRNGASFAIYDYSLRRFSDRIVNLGGAAGTTDSPGDGLARFKAGFSNQRGTAHLCGAILDAQAYRALCGEHRGADDAYFPAYRSPR